MAPAGETRPRAPCSSCTDTRATWIGAHGAWWATISHTPGWRFLADQLLPQRHHAVTPHRNSPTSTPSPPTPIRRELDEASTSSAPCGRRVAPRNPNATPRCRWPSSGTAAAEALPVWPLLKRTRPSWFRAETGVDALVTWAAVADFLPRFPQGKGLEPGRPQAVGDHQPPHAPEAAPRLVLSRGLHRQ